MACVQGTGLPVLRAGASLRLRRARRPGPLLCLALLASWTPLAETGRLRLHGRASGLVAPDPWRRGRGADEAPVEPRPLGSLSASAGNVSVRFHVDCSLTKPGERVFVVGSLPELGAWDPGGALQCETSTEAFPIWTCAEEIPLRGQSELKIEFKVLLKSEKSATWESGPNRVLRVSEKSALIDATMSWCDPWVKVMATGRLAVNEKVEAERALEQLATAQIEDLELLAEVQKAEEKMAEDNADGDRAAKRLASTQRQKQKAARLAIIRKAEEVAKMAERREATWRRKAAEARKKAADVRKAPAFAPQKASDMPDLVLSCLGSHNHWDRRECAVENVKEWQDAVERYAAKYGKSTLGMRELLIPKHIHQIWVGPGEPPCVWLDTWRVDYMSVNPGWDYTLWTDAQVEKLEMDNRDIYDGEGMWQCKADILRLEILWRYGGIYIDADIVSIKNRDIEELIERSKETGWSIAYEPDTKDKPISVLGNSVICCTPYHPLTMMLIKYLKATFGPKRRHLQVFELTGPVMYTKCLTDMPYTVLPMELLYPAFHYVPNPGAINFERFPKALMFQFGYTCSGLEGWVKRNNHCRYGHCQYHFPVKWELGPNRVLMLSAQEESFDVSMVWGDTGIKLQTEPRRRKADGTVTVRFQVEFSETRPGERVFFVGSLPELGAWDPAHALPCDTSEQAFPVWTSAETTVSLQGSQEKTIEFKVLVQGAESAGTKKAGLPAVPQRKSEEEADAELVADEWAAVKAQWAEHLEGMKN